MKLRRNKKGFTIVELVIVIAVIGVLAAILIPTFINLTNKANKAADESLVKNLNTALAMQEQEPGDTKNNTMHDAVEDLKSYGYLVENLVTKSDEKLLWNQKTNRFLLEDRDADEIAKPEYAKTDFWRIQDDDNDTDGFSIYAGLGFTATTVDVKVGFDVGSYENIQSVTYTSDSKKTVSIRTNGGTLVVNDAGTDGKVLHFGTLNNADITTDDNCFHTHGIIAKLALNNGKVVAKEGGYVGLIEAENGTKAEEDGGTIYIPAGTAATEISEEIIDNLGYTVSGGNIVEQPTTDKSFKIGSKKSLITFRDAWNNGSIASNKIKLEANIDIADSDWLPIGTWEYPFYGTFDGGNKTITGLTKTRLSNEDIYSTGTTTKYMGVVFGFFGIVGGGDVEIKDLTMTNVNIDLPTGVQVGSIYGYSPKNGDFKDSNKAGEFAPKYANNATIGTDDVVLSNITTTGSIQAKQHTGGLLGKAYNTGELKVTDCVNNCNLVVHDSCGGIAGYVNGQSAITFDGCTNNGTIASTSSFAGIVNSSNSMALTVKNSTNTGSLVWTGNTYNTIGWVNTASSDTDRWGFIANATELSKKTLVNNTNTGSFTVGSNTIYGPSDGRYSYSFTDSNGHILTLNIRDHFFTLKLDAETTIKGRWAIGSNSANLGSFLMRNKDTWEELYVDVKNVKTADAFVINENNSTFGEYGVSFNITGDDLALIKTIISIAGDDSNDSWNLHIH